MMADTPAAAPPLPHIAKRRERVFLALAGPQACTSGAAAFLARSLDLDEMEGHA